jgi:cysteine desulfurase
MGVAAALECGGMESWATTPEQHAGLKQTLSGTARVLSEGEQASHILALVHPTMSAQALLIRLDAMGFAVSAGSACSSGTLKKSRVLDAFGIEDESASRTIRVSMGWSTTPEELGKFAEAWASLK